MKDEECTQEHEGVIKLHVIEDENKGRREGNIRQYTTQFAVISVRQRVLIKHKRRFLLYVFNQVTEITEENGVWAW